MSTENKLIKEKNQLIKEAQYGSFQFLQEKLAEKRDINLVKTYFSCFKENAVFDNCLNFFTKVILAQINERYEDNKTKYKSKEEFEEYQNGLFYVLVEMNDYLWRNYLSLDERFRREYSDVISKIDVSVFIRFLYTQKPKKTELQTLEDQEKRNAYNKVLESFFYRNITGQILSEQQCHDLSLALYKNVDKLPDEIDNYMYHLNHNDFLTTLWGDFVTLTNKIESFDWSKKLDKNNEKAKLCLEYIKKINKDVKDPGLFNLYAQFLEDVIIPQINESKDKEKYNPERYAPYNILPDYKKTKFNKLKEKNYDKHQNGLFEILVKINDLIWEIIDSKLLSKYERNRLLACYYNLIKKIDGHDLERIGDLLNERKEKAMKSKNKNEVMAYNKLVRSLIFWNLKHETISAHGLYWMGIPNLIDEKTFEEYTDDLMVKKLFVCAAIEPRLSGKVRRSTIKIRKSDKNKKICFESIFGGFINSVHCMAVDTTLSLLKNDPADLSIIMDFDLSTINESTLESNNNLKKYISGFISIYNSLAKNDFHVAPDLLRSKLPNGSEYPHHEKVFLYLGSWIIPLLGKKTDFNTAYKILSKRLDSLCAVSKIKIDKKVKDKLIIQTLVYATNSLSPLSELGEEKSIYRTLMMLTGEKKFVKGYKFSLRDIKQILSSAKNSVLATLTVLEFCKDHRAEDVRLTDLVKLAHDMKVPFIDSIFSGSYAYLDNDRDRRFGERCLFSMGTTILNKNDIEAYITELPNNLKVEEFDILFSIFESRSAFEKERSSDENKKIQKLFVKVVNKIPTGYLSQKKFDSLADYFTRENTDNAINLTPYEFNKFMLKINKQMDQKDRSEFKRRMIKYFRIDGRNILDQEIENAYNNIQNSTELAFQTENESYHQNSDMSNMDTSTPVYPNINAVDREDNNFGENITDVPEPVYQNIYIKLIANNNQNQTQNLNEFDKAAKLAQINNEIDREKKDFQDWISGKKQNNPLWVLIAWAFKLWFEHKFEQKRKSLEKTNGNSQPNNNFSKPKSEETPNINDKNKGENNRDPKD